MKRQKRRRGSSCLGILLLACFICACNPREDGCLDIEAENFAFDADKHEQALCRYPDLLLNVFYQWADTSLQTARLYTTDAGQDYAIHAVQVLLSGFEITDNDGEELVIERTIDIRSGDCAAGMVSTVPDDFVIVDRMAFNYVIGPFRRSGPMRQFRLTTGVPAAYLPFCPEHLAETHRLRNARMGFDTLSGAFALSRFVISRDSVNAVRDTLFGYMSPQELAFDVNRMFRPGRRDTLYLAIDFEQIFGPADIRQSREILGNDLASRVPSAIMLR